MPRAFVLAVVLVLVAGLAFGQATSVLHIRVVLVDESKTATPVARHRLLISDNPATAAPRLVITGQDGTASVTLKPGNYTVESDRPTTFRGKSYQWTQTLDVAAGRDATLELTVGNAEVGPALATGGGDVPLESDPSIVLPKWERSVVAVWTPTRHASGFLVDARGLVVTNQRVVGSATTAEVQLSPTVKVAANVLIADRGRDVSVLAIDPAAITGVTPIPLACGSTERKPVSDGQKIFTISNSLFDRKDTTEGTIQRVDPHRMVSDFDLGSGSGGGPVFAENTDFIGVTSIVDERDRNARDETPVVRVNDVCEVVAAAEQQLASAARPGGTQLPVEPAMALPSDALKDAAEHRAGSLSPYQLSSSSFDIAFITPVMTYGALHQAQVAGGASRAGGTRSRSSQVQVTVGPLLDFANWSDYANAFPPVLFVRVTPKMVENFWTTVARGAAVTQGVSLPAMKHFNGSFVRLRAFCGNSEVTPIHPFKIEHQVSASEVVYEGFYAFDPDAFSPRCGTVKLSLYSEKEPEKEDSRMIDAKVVEQIWQDFAPYRSQSPAP